MKRLIDLILVTISAPVWMLVLGIFGIVVRTKIGTPVLFKQLRPGRMGRPFVLVKLRTMTDERDREGKLLPDADRLTRTGRWLRATSLDELPELWNVLTGSMSLVGPRPLLMEYLPLYTVEQAKRHNVRPGITGLAQVSGRNAIGWDEKFALDVWYVDNRSTLLDLKILALTVLRVLQRHGISAAGGASMPRFDGSPITPAAPAAERSQRNPT